MNATSAVVRFFIAALAIFAAVVSIAFGSWKAIFAFTLLSNLGLAYSFIWTGVTLLKRKRTPREEWAGSAVFYVLITGLVYNFVLARGSFGLGEPILLGLSNSDIAHVATPLAAFVVWAVLAEHRRIPWRYVGLWLVALAGYLALILIAVALIPALDAPYPFLDVSARGLGSVVWSITGYMVAFAALAALVVSLDTLLPAHTSISEYDPFDQ